MSTASASIRSGLPPGPKGTLIGGNIRQFRAELLDFLLDTARDYGPLASFRVGPRRVFLASGPDLIEQVLVIDAKHYIKHFGARAFKPVLGNGLVTSEGAFWQRQRKLIQPAFSKTRVHIEYIYMRNPSDRGLELINDVSWWWLKRNSERVFNDAKTAQSRNTEVTLMWNRWRSTLFTWYPNVIAIGPAGSWPLWSVRTIIFYGLSVVLWLSYFYAFFRLRRSSAPLRDRNPDRG